MHLLFHNLHDYIYTIYIYAHCKYINLKENLVSEPVFTLAVNLQVPLVVTCPSLPFVHWQAFHLIFNPPYFICSYACVLLHAVGFCVFCAIYIMAAVVLAFSCAVSYAKHLLIIITVIT